MRVILQCLFGVFVFVYLSGCVFVTTVDPERDKYLSYSCAQLEGELQYMGAIRTDAEEDQGLSLIHI